MTVKMTETQRRIINQSIDDMVRNRRGHADTLTASPRKDVRRRMADAGWLHHEGLTGPLTRKAFEDVGRLADYPEPTDPEVRELEAPAVAEKSPVVEEFPSAFEGAPPVRTHADGSQTYGPYVMPDAAVPPTGAGSSVVVVLEKVWGKIREDTPELPDVVIVTGSGMIGPPRWGHFRSQGWTERAEKDVATNLVIGEMFVAGETLARGAAHTLETMLHEAAHVLAGVRDIKDTSRQGRWHNQRFRALAEGLGLEYSQESAHPQHGFSEVGLTPGTTEQYAGVIEELDQAIRLTVTIPVSFQSAEGEQGAGEYMGHHGARKPRAEGSSATNNVKATCDCWPKPRIIRASRKVLEGARITCEECKEAFMDRSE